MVIVANKKKDMPNWLKNKIEYDKQYQKETYKQVSVKLNCKSDADIINFLDNQPNKLEAIRNALRDYIEKRKDMEK